MLSRRLVEMLPEYIKAGVLAEYDLSPQLREEHDKKAEFNSKGERIKSSAQERWEYNKKILTTHIISEEKRLKKNEKIVNLWI